MARRLTARRLAALAALLVAFPALAGCSDPEDELSAGTTTSGSSTANPMPGSTGTGTTTSAPPPRIKSPNERWHFHDYWGQSPTITLVEGWYRLAPTTGADGLPALSAIVELPQNVIVPPETGSLEFNVTWNETALTKLNLTFRPADSNDFHPAGDLARQVPLKVNTTESMCDVPHRQQSFWRLNFSAVRPSGVPPVASPVEFHLNLSATIGRPLFIDAPHINWWQDMEMIPLVTAASGTFQGAATPVANVSLPDDLSPTSTTPATFTQRERVPVDAGRIVPEGAKSVVVMLNWTDASPPGAKLKVRWKEGNSLTEGVLDVAVDSEGGRVFSLPVTPGQTDTTYSNRTTWEFHVLPDSEPAAFHGSYTLVAWASRLTPEATVAALTQS